LGHILERSTPEDTPGVIVVLETTCDGPFTYKVVGEEAEYMGQGDLPMT
jgi:hypothetical protein